MVHSTCRCGGFIFWLTIIQQTIRPDIVPCKSNRQYTWSKTFVPSPPLHQYRKNSRSLPAWSPQFWKDTKLMIVARVAMLQPTEACVPGA